MNDKRGNLRPLMIFSFAAFKVLTLHLNCSKKLSIPAKSHSILGHQGTISSMEMAELNQGDVTGFVKSVNELENKSENNTDLHNIHEILTVVKYILKRNWVLVDQWI